MSIHEDCRCLHIMHIESPGYPMYNNKQMKFFFVLDSKKNYRFFSSGKITRPQIRFSHWQKLWEMAKKKLMLLPKRILSQEQAFDHISKLPGGEVSIHYSGLVDANTVHRKSFFFLQKQRSKHIIFLIGETILLPISGLMAVLPGPNVFFGFLALIMYTHWRALKGINHLLRKERRFIASSLLAEWENALKQDAQSEQPMILDRLSRELGIKDLKTILMSK